MGYFNQLLKFERLFETNSLQFVQGRSCNVDLLDESVKPYWQMASLGSKAICYQYFSVNCSSLTTQRKELLCFGLGTTFQKENLPESIENLNILVHKTSPINHYFTEFAFSFKIITMLLCAVILPNYVKLIFRMWQTNRQK